MAQGLCQLPQRSVMSGDAAEISRLARESLGAPKGSSSSRRRPSPDPPRLLVAYALGALSTSAAEIGAHDETYAMRDLHR